MRVGTERERPGVLRPLLAAVLASGATAGLFSAVGSADVSGYVSVTGIAGAPHGAVYRLSVYAVAAAAGMLGWALWARVRPAALALAVATPCVALSAAVPCSAGCPLPPYRTTTAADLLHAAASAAGVGCCTLAMLALAMWSGETALRRVSVVVFAVTAPLLVGVALTMLLVGQGVVAGLLERASLVACLAWLVTVALLLCRRRAGPDRSGQRAMAAHGGG